MFAVLLRGVGLCKLKNETQQTDVCQCMLDI
jgi:hypothetical protein